MKLQCPCGAKYAFDLTPEMLQNPVKFVCPTCGLDSSEFINDMVRKEFGSPNMPEPEPPQRNPEPAPVSRLKLSREEKPAETPVETAPVSKYCQKHRGVLATEKCTVCHKPICPQCMELFGFFCSPLCKNKADLQGIAAPVYAGQKFEVERRFWRKTGLISSLCFILVLAALGAWVWYAWFGAVPHPYFAVRFEDTDRAYSGKALLVGPDQLVFLHGGTLARYDLKTKKSVWSQDLISKDDIAAAVKEVNDAIAREANENGGHADRVPQADIERGAKIGFQEELQLRVSGQNIWVAKGDTLTRYDWATGNAAQTVTLPEFAGAFTQVGDELQLLGAQSVTHVSLASGESHVDRFSEPGAKPALATGAKPANGGLLSGGSQPMDPNKVQEQAQNLTLPGQKVLPALVANAQHQQAIQAAMNDDPQRPRPAADTASREGQRTFQLVAGPTGYAQFSVTLLKENLVQRNAMKDAPKQSALDGNANAAHTSEIVNEQLNEMQRNSGGGTVTEDESTYSVAVHVPDAADAADWTAQVTGPLHLFVLKTVNVVAAGKSLVVLDKSNKKLWEATLTYPVPAGEFDGEEPKYGAGPCVEHGDTLYVFDQAVLSAYDLATGNARWRLPSVGVVGLFFDAENNLFVNTTSGNPDDIRYSRQIDIDKVTDDVLLKLDPKTGKTLWSIKPGGFISYLSGKFIYIVQSYDPNPTDLETASDMMIQKPAFLHIARINPANGHLMWLYQDDRCPINVKFDDNSIELVFKREVQVLRYLSF